MKKIVVIGRPNVGKSSFINRLLGKKMAITAREEGLHVIFVTMIKYGMGNHLKYAIPVV